MEPTPAQRYAAARRRQQGGAPQLADFERLYPFALDSFQLDACRALAAGEGVLVAAPTGSGKTVVGEFAVHLALRQGGKCFYTTPVKALSNQKFADLCDRYGAEQVGLLTGDNSIRSEASVVVMTTEVLRNMLYAGSGTLRDLRYVVMDEVHYLADRARGAVWEEVLITLPESVSVVSLSATVSNTEEFGEWLAAVRGTTRVVIEERRPVPLYQHVMVGGRLHDVFVDEAANRTNPYLAELARESAARAPQSRRGRAGKGRSPAGRGSGRARGARGDRTRGNRTLRRSSRVEVLRRMERLGLLPAIVFVFSRAGCDDAVAQCMSAGVSLTNTAEMTQIRTVLERRCAHIPAADRAAVGFHQWASALEHGVAAHHAGMLPAFKETVEEVFAAGLVRVVFATETLALGINMPARSVVLEQLEKWDGSRHAEITPEEYTQLTGRAGRRGIDVEGHAVLAYSPGMDPTVLAGLASSRTYPLRSSFTPTYNMAVNMVRRVGGQRARALLSSSFAQFQADRSVVTLTRRLTRNAEAAQRYRSSMQCDRGDIATYLALLEAERALHAGEGSEGSHEASREPSTVSGVGVGDVLSLPQAHGVVVSIEDAGLVAVTVRGHLFRGQQSSVGDTSATARSASLRLTDPRLHLDVPGTFDPTVAEQRTILARRLAQLLREQGVPTPPESGEAGKAAPAALPSTRSLDRADQARRLRREIEAHPCHHCPERADHLTWARRLDGLAAEDDRLRRKAGRRTASLATRFDRVTAALQTMGYLHGDLVTEAGEVLAGVYGELDLLTAQCLQEGLFDELTPAELAGVVSMLTYTSRRDSPTPPTIPRGRIRDCAAALQRVHEDIRAVEDDEGLPPLRVPDAGFVVPCYRWARGADLSDVLGVGELTAGDFVRAVKSVIDTLGQIVAVTPSPTLSASADEAVSLLRRGVVDYSSVVPD